MPFIRRNRAATADSTFSTTTHAHEFYVRARDVQKGDVVIPPEQLDDITLADLAKTHPKEFAKAALERGLVPLEDEDDDELEPDVDDEEQTYTAAQEQFMLLNAEKAIAAVKAAANDPALLAEYAEAEAGKAQPRKTVLEALQAAIES